MRVLVRLRDLLREHRMCWLGYVAHMGSDRSVLVSCLVPVLVMARRSDGATSLLVTWCHGTSRLERGT